MADIPYFKECHKLRDGVEKAGLLLDDWSELKEIGDWEKAWINRVNREVIDKFTISDFELLVECIPAEDNNVEQWDKNILTIFMKRPNFINRLVTDVACDGAFLCVSGNPIKRCWDLRALNLRITRANLLLSHVAIWLNPTSLKITSLKFLDHLQSCYFEHHCPFAWKGYLCAGQRCEKWKEHALKLQSAVVAFARDGLPDNAEMMAAEHFIALHPRKSNRNIFYAKSFWQFLLKTLVLFDNALLDPLTKSLYSPISGAQYKSSDHNGKTGSRMRATWKFEPLGTLKLPARRDEIPDSQPTLLITLKLPARRDEIPEIRLKESTRQESSAHIDKVDPGPELSTPSSEQVRIICSNKGPPASSNGSKIKSTIGGVHKLPTRKNHPVAIQSVQSLSPSSHPTNIKSVRRPVFGTPKRRCLSSTEPHFQSSTSYHQSFTYKHQFDPVKIRKVPSSKSTSNSVCIINPSQWRR